MHLLVLLLGAYRPEGLQSGAYSLEAYSLAPPDLDSAGALTCSLEKNT